MSLLQNEDFVLYQLRTSYLSCIKDGVGERLINVNSSVLNSAAFRAAGWQPNASDIKRTYSPPIPTAITAEYFQAPRPLPMPAVDDEDEIGGREMVGSNETVGPGLNTRRRRRKEHQQQQQQQQQQQYQQYKQHQHQHMVDDDDDSSDLSDDSDEDGDSRTVNQIKFTKMALRSRAGSSPLRSSTLRDGPSVLIPSPSRPNDPSQLRRGSLGSVETPKGTRPRRDTTATTTTTTSSELSSENEIDPAFFQRKPINTRRARASQFLADRIQEDEREGEADLDEEEEEEEEEDDDGGNASDTTLSSAFVGSADSASILNVENPLGSLTAKLSGMPFPGQRSSPKKQRANPPLLDALPPPRPISVMAPVSLLTQAMKAKDKSPDMPFEKFATLSGKGDPNPLYIKIYPPSSCNSDKPFELLLRRLADGGAPVTVAAAIGLALWRYGEDKLKPDIGGPRANVNRWNFRMVEDGEVDYDFPALNRVNAISDFTSINNRGVRGRSRDNKPWDEFALVEANEREFKENEATTPSYSSDATSAHELYSAASAPLLPPIAASQPTPTYNVSFAPPTFSSFRNPIIGPAFAPAMRKDGIPLDVPATMVSHATPRTGAPKTLKIHFTDDNFLSRSTIIEVTTDTYIAEVFDQVCKRLNVDKGLYVLKISNTTIVALPDRTVEALGDRSDLDLVRRRFVGDGAFGLSGSPGSSSPNAPLLIAPGGTPKKFKPTKAGAGSSGGSGHPLAQKQDALLLTNSGALYKRYNVIRKQPMSFSSSSARILMLDGEYMHIMPSEGPKAMWEGQGKTTTVPFSSVVGCKVSRKHPRMFRVVVFKERESKRYDFESTSADEAAEIVTEIRKGMEGNARGFNDTI